MRLRLLPLAFCLLLGACATETVKRDLSESERRDDLNFLVTVFAEREQSFTPQTHELFLARVSAIDERIATMSQDEFLVAIQGAVAAADNGHTEALTHELQRLRLPLDLHWFEDGLHVIAVRPGYEALLGARVAAIAERSPEDLLHALDDYAPGTDEHVRILSGYFLERPELLFSIGVAEAPDALAITFEMPDGTRLSRNVPAYEGESTARAADRITLLDAIGSLPPYLREPEKAAYVVWFPDIDAIYIRINRNDDKDLPRDLEEVLRAIDTRNPRHAIVDLRLNGGGNFELTAPFAEALPERVPKDGKLVLILGNQTFSAGIITAAILKAKAPDRTLVVGERMGDNLQFWSEGGLLTLPNSGLRIHYSDGYHDWANGYDPGDPRFRTNARIAEVIARHSAAAGSLEPDLRIGLGFADYAKGHDPAMSEVFAILGD